MNDSTAPGRTPTTRPVTSDLLVGVQKALYEVEMLRDRLAGVPCRPDSDLEQVTDADLARIIVNRLSLIPLILEERIAALALK